MTWSSEPWRTTPRLRGSGCTSRGGFEPRCSGQTVLGRSERRARRKAVSSAVAGESLPALCVRSLDADGPFRTSSSSAMRTMRSSTAGARRRRSGARGDPRSVRAVRSGASSDEDQDRVLQGRRPDEEYEHVEFDFLGYTFQPRRAKNRWGKFFVSFLPAISAKAAKAIRKTIREWRMASTRNNQRLEDLARLVNPSVRGWMNYYGRFYRSKCVQVLRHLNGPSPRGRDGSTSGFDVENERRVHWLGRIAQRDPKLFVLWQLGVRPEAGK